MQLSEVDEEFNLFEEPESFVYIMLPNSVVDKNILKMNSVMYYLILNKF